MKSSTPQRIASALILICLLPLLTQAQGDPTSPGRPPQGDPRPPTIIRQPARTVYVTPTTGSLTIVARPGAHITLEYLNNRGKVVNTSQSTVSRGETAIILNELKRGRYRIKGELDGYSPDEQTKVVLPNKQDKVELNLVPITYDLAFNVNAGSGMIRYLKDGRPSGWMPFDNGRAQLSGLPPGDYEFEVKPGDPSYEPLKTLIKVSKSESRDLVLTKHESTGEFLSGSATDWKLPPAGWAFKSGILKASARGVALPQDDSFRYYKDFQLSADVKLLNGVAASFAVRARDPLNYYLIQLTGPNADEPYRLRGFIVKDGTPQPFGLKPSIRQIDDLLRSNNFFHVALTMKDNRLQVEVLDSETNKLSALGFFEDPNRTYGIGAVGVASHDNEHFEIGSFLVCAPVCRTR